MVQVTSSPGLQLLYWLQLKPIRSHDSQQQDDTAKAFFTSKLVINKLPCLKQRTTELDSEKSFRQHANVKLKPTF